MEIRQLCFGKEKVIIYIFTIYYLILLILKLLYDAGYVNISFIKPILLAQFIVFHFDNSYSLVLVDG